MTQPPYPGDPGQSYPPQPGWPGQAAQPQQPAQNPAQNQWAAQPTQAVQPNWNQQPTEAAQPAAPAWGQQPPTQQQPAGQWGATPYGQQQAAPQYPPTSTYDTAGGGFNLGAVWPTLATGVAALIALILVFAGPWYTSSINPTGQAGLSASAKPFDSDVTGSVKTWAIIFLVAAILTVIAVGLSMFVKHVALRFAVPGLALLTAAFAVIELIDINNKASDAKADLQSAVANGGTASAGPGWGAYAALALAVIALALAVLAYLRGRGEMGGTGAAAAYGTGYPGQAAGYGTQPQWGQQPQQPQWGAPDAGAAQQQPQWGAPGDSGAGAAQPGAQPQWGQAPQQPPQQPQWGQQPGQQWGQPPQQ